jgi:hypothetical protein
MELTQEEIATIEKKRSVKRTKLLVSLEKENAKKRKALATAQKEVQEDIQNSIERLERKKEFLAKLQEVGDFVLEIETLKRSETPYYYFGEGLKRHDLDEIKYEIQVGTITYNGETVEVMSRGQVKPVVYTIGIEEHITKSEYYPYRGKSKGFKMNVSGLKKHSHQRSDYGKRITRPEKVLELILEDIEYRKRIIEDENAKKSLKERAIAEIKRRFKGADIDTESSVYKSKSFYDAIAIEFKNGVSLKVTFSEDWNDETKIKYTVYDLRYPKSGIDLIELLSKLNFS